MFVRMKFASMNKVSEDTLKQLEEYLGEEVRFSYMKLYEDGESVSYSSWSETFDPEVAEKEDKKLVEKAPFVQLGTDKEYLIDFNDFVQNFPAVKLEVRGITQSRQTSSAAAIADNLLGVQQKLENALARFDQQVEFNEKVQVHIGNLGMLNINQVGYAVDHCTERLQDILNKGWRILAVCPQPDQRRPDYVLGRFNGDADNKVEWVEF